MLSRSNWNLDMLAFEERGKPEYPEKNLSEQERTNNKLIPHMTPGLGIELGPHWWEASTLTTAPSLLPEITASILNIRDKGRCSLRSKSLSNIRRAVLGNATRKARVKLGLLAFPYSYTARPKLLTVSACYAGRLRTMWLVIQWNPANSKSQGKRKTVRVGRVAVTFLVSC